MGMDVHTTAGKLADLTNRRAEALNPSPPEAVEKVHAQGKLTARERIHALLERLTVLPNEITLLLDREGGAEEAEAIDRIANIPLTRVSGAEIDQGKALAKRGQDVVFGALALFLATPIMVLVALAIKLDTPGPVFFRQRRHGFNNEEIVVWKFRSMGWKPPTTRLRARSAPMTTG